MRTASPKLILLLLLSVAFTFGTMAHLRSVSRADALRPDEGAFKKLLGDGRSLFAGQFVAMADVYFHSGLYPSIFDRREMKAPKAVTAEANQDLADGHHDHEHDEHGNCIGASAHEGHEHDEHGNCQHGTAEDEHAKAMTPAAAQNWLEAFIRKFRITEHTHLSDGDEREIMPWLKMAIELDPQATDTYITAAYWLRKKLDRVDQAEKVLREGIRNNPTSHELLFEMGLLYKENRGDVERARNIWRYALECWGNQSEAERKEHPEDCSKIAANLAKLEREAGNLPLAIKFLELAKVFSPAPEGIQSQIDEIRAALDSPNRLDKPSIAP